VARGVWRVTCVGQLAGTLDSGPWTLEPWNCDGLDVIDGRSTECALMFLMVGGWCFSDDVQVSDG